MTEGERDRGRGGERKREDGDSAQPALRGLYDLVRQADTWLCSSGVIHRTTVRKRGEDKERRGAREKRRRSEGMKGARRGGV